MDILLSKEKKIQIIMESDDFKRLYEKVKTVYSKEYLANMIYDKAIPEYEKDFPPSSPLQ